MWDSIVPWLQITPGGLVALTVVSLIRGWLIPRATHGEIVRHLEDTIRAQKETICERDKQVAILLGQVREPAS